MSRPDLSPLVRDEWIDGQRQLHNQHLAATRRIHRPLWPDLLHGMRLIAWHAFRLTVWAVVLVAGVALSIAYLTQGAPLP